MTEPLDHLCGAVWGVETSTRPAGLPLHTGQNKALSDEHGAST